jgi:hypothetical protein
MEILINKMDNLMSSNLKDIIAGAYKYKDNRKERIIYIQERMEQNYPKILWSVLIYTDGNSSVKYSDTYYFSCEFRNDTIIIFGNK